MCVCWLFRHISSIVEDTRSLVELHRLLTGLWGPCREPEWGVWEIIKLVLMGLLWGAFVLLVAHGSTWLGRWWDNNVGTPGTPSWRRK